MLFAGISWTGQGFDLAVLDEEGRYTTPLRHFAAGQALTLMGHLRNLHQSAAAQFGCIVDSTNGLLDGMMMEAGLRVYRADPSSLPTRPEFGSVAAESLARAAVNRLSDLVLLRAEVGFLTGRRSDLFRETARSERGIAALTQAGRYLAHGDRSGSAKPIALSFDDGPNPPYTGMILDVLAQYGVPATFFCVGQFASVHANELARMAERGHQLGNHTWSHPFLPDLSERELEMQIARTDEAIASATGRPTSRLFRPPYGARSPRLISWLAERQHGHRIALWDVNSGDWTRPGADAITRTVLEQARPGSIVLLHDGGGDRGQTVAALPAIIEGLLASGYHFTVVGSFFTAKRDVGHA